MWSEICYLLQLEDVLVEVMLQRLVGEVDAELLEAVVLVVLEAEDVQHADGQDLKHTHLSHQVNVKERWCRSVIMTVRADHCIDQRAQRHWWTISHWRQLEPDNNVCTRIITSYMCEQI